MSYPLPRRDVEGFVRSVEETLRRPAVVWDGMQPVAEFSPDLSPAEQAEYLELARLHRSRLGVTPAEFATLRPDIADLRAYVLTGSPTAGQTVAAVKSLIRVLRAVLD